MQLQDLMSCDLIPKPIAETILTTLSEACATGVCGVYLGGSRAKGIAMCDSDFDFFIELESSDKVFECVRESRQLVHLRGASSQFVLRNMSPEIAPTLHLLANSLQVYTQNPSVSLGTQAKIQLNHFYQKFHDSVFAIPRSYLLMELICLSHDIPNKLRRAQELKPVTLQATKVHAQKSLLLLAEKFYLRSFEESIFEDIERSYFLKTTNDLRFYTPDVILQNPWIREILELGLNLEPSKTNIIDIFRSAFSVHRSEYSHELADLNSYIHFHK